MATREKPILNNVRVKNATSLQSVLTPDAASAIDFLVAFERLDRILDRAVAEAEFVFLPHTADNHFRGLHIHRDEVEHLLLQTPGEPLFGPAVADSSKMSAPNAIQNSRLGILHRVFDLSSFDVDVLLLALAPEVDRRYELIYAYLQDHVARQRPSVDLALHLLCANALERIERRRSFDTAAPLLRTGIMRLLPDPRQPLPSLLAHVLHLDDQIVRFLLQHDGLDARLVPFCMLVDADASPTQTLPAVKDHTKLERPTRLLYFQAPPQADTRQVGASLAGKAGCALLVVDLVSALDAGVNCHELLQSVFRYCQLYDAIPFIEGWDELAQEQHRLLRRQVYSMLAAQPGLVIFTGTQPWQTDATQPLGVATLPFHRPDCIQRGTAWRRSLANDGVRLAPGEIEFLANRFCLWPSQIAEAVATARATVQWRNGHESNDVVTIVDLIAAARAQAGHRLAELTSKVEPVHTWEDLVLPEDTLAQLHEICAHVLHRQRVLEEWGFDRKLSLGKGTAALFAGPSGTGKTMAAEVIANALSLDLYRIDLSQVVSKYIGETEKNLGRIFAAAEDSNAILFFDEADALFGKRSEVRDAHDRYANIEVAYLLQKMEEHRGLAILATNLRGNLDDAFTRRMAFIVGFPFPDEASRRLIWRGVWPKGDPAATADLDRLARQFKLSGGHIKNIALAAAYLAADNGGHVTMDHLLHATRREYQKLGKALSAAELNGE